MRPNNWAIVYENADEKSETEIDVLSVDTTFSGDDGSPPRTITLKLGVPIATEMGWAVQIEILGFDHPYRQSIYGEDWAQAIELAAQILPIVLEEQTHEAGGGTMAPAFFPRTARMTDVAALPPEIAQVFANAPAGKETDD